MAPSALDIEEEQRHFSNVISTFQNYASYSLAASNRRRKDLFTLPQADQELLSSLGYKEKLEEVDKAIITNAEFLKQVVADPEIFGHDVDDGDDEETGEGEQVEGRNLSSQSQEHQHTHNHDGPDQSHSRSHSHHNHHSGGHDQNHGHSHDHGGRRQKRYKPTEFDMDKLRSTLKQLVRDWSEEGAEERKTSYEPMKEALLAHFSDIPREERRNFRVLVPGAGLGRLAYDVANLGFACQGNEFSHYMLLTSFLILNRSEEVKIHTIYPYVHSFSNVPTRASMLRAISIPDVLPNLPAGSNFSLVAGDFEEIYGGKADPDEPQSGLWDAVMTCFFIDTAKNIVNYLRIIHRILAPGGVWINLGPLLWHWENNNTNDPSVELDLAEVKELARKIGFELKVDRFTLLPSKFSSDKDFDIYQNEKTIDATYTTNSEGMLGYTYRTAFWTATKIL
ncbi:hypothetical protein D9758_003878 [Tetrapyrgos nigripes]|uniref:carnosine N-methyltransferase n=1 Tax=Tetrapyrgos nigripes TaxID=182062 RepID=A0A8H5LRS6_9AGAR|nr:hypothetical protein D9758_003878 [Tetrapyrgos nigripes]